MKTERLWEQLREEAKRVVRKEELLAGYVHACVLDHENLEASLGFILSHKLSDDVMPAITLRELFHSAFDSSPDLIDCCASDIRAAHDRDPAVQTLLAAALHLKGFHSIQVHRMAHFLWSAGRRELALFIQSRNSEVFGVDIHPACVMGRGIMFDHATGIVIGETSVIDDNVSIMQQVTLGGTGNEQGDRHPKVRSGVLIAAGATVLGNIVVNEGARVGAGSVVLSDVAARTTVAGVPARVIARHGARSPAETMDQRFSEKEPAERS